MDDFKRNATDTARDVEQGVGNAAHKVGQGLGDAARNVEDTVEGVFNRDNAVPTAQESLADAVEGLRQDAGPQGRTLAQAEEQGVLQAGHDSSAATPGFFGDHRAIDDASNNEDNR